MLFFLIVQRLIVEIGTFLFIKDNLVRNILVASKVYTSLNIVSVIGLYAGYILTLQTILMNDIASKHKMKNSQDDSKINYKVSGKLSKNSFKRPIRDTTTSIMSINNMDDSLLIPSQEESDDEDSYAIEERKNNRIKKHIFSQVLSDKNGKFKR